MADKIDLGHGAYLEPDEPPRNTPFHKRIVKAERIPGTRCGNQVDLECGHRVISFGDLTHTAGIVMCLQCRDAAQRVADA